MNFLIIGTLILLWIIAGGFVTQANVYLGPFKKTNGYFGTAYWTTFSAAFITWFLIGMIILIGILAAFGIVALFGSGVGEVAGGGAAAAGGVAVAGEGAVVAAEGAEGLEVGAEGLKEAESAAKAGAQEAKVAEEEAQEAEKAAKAAGKDVSKASQQAKQAEKEAEESQKAQKEIEREQKIEQKKKKSLITESISWFEYFLIGIAFTLSFTTGILAAVAANAMNKAGFDRSNAKLNKAYTNCIIAASLCLGASGLIILAFLGLEIYREEQKRRVKNIQELEVKQRQQAVQLQAQKEAESKARLQDLQRKSAEERAQRQADLERQKHEQALALQQAQFEVAQQKIYAQANLPAPSQDIFNLPPTQGGMVIPPTLATTSTTAIPPPRPPPRPAVPAVPATRSPNQCYTNLSLNPGANPKEALEQYTRLTQAVPQDECEKNECCRNAFGIIKDSTRKILTNTTSQGCAPIPACQK